MKIVVINRDTQSVKPYITLRPDNAVLRNNDDFYLPNFSNDIICNGGIIVRISRLAKCIAPKFASRCYDGITTGVTFIARDVMQNALSETRPTDEAYSFDRSTAIGTEWFTPEQITEKGVLEMSINRATSISGNRTNTKVTPSPSNTDTRIIRLRALRTRSYAPFP